MSQGPYIAEFERVLTARKLALGQRALSDLIAALDFSRLAEVSQDDRLMFYEALADTVPRGGDDRSFAPDGREMLAGRDSFTMIGTMQSHAAQFALPDRVRDIWCMIYIGGCP